MTTLLILIVDAPVLVSKVASDLLWLTLIEPNSSAYGTICAVPVLSVIVALAVLVVSVTDVALIITMGLDTTLAGGVYVVAVPLAVVDTENAPHADAQTVPLCSRLQVSCGGVAGSLRMVAMNCCEPVLTGMSADAGDTEIVTASTVIVMLPDFVESLAATAEIVTARLLPGGVDGAV